MGGGGLLERGGLFEGRAYIEDLQWDIKNSHQDSRMDRNSGSRRRERRTLHYWEPS